MAAPADAQGRSYDKGDYYANIKAWVKRGGNLVLTDRALHALGDLGVVAADAITTSRSTSRMRTSSDFDHPMTRGPAQQRAPARRGRGPGLRDRQRRLADDGGRHRRLGGRRRTRDRHHHHGTTGEDPAIDRNLDDGSLTSVGELALGKGEIRIVGGALPTPTEEQDHRYGLRNYALTYSGLFLMENTIRHDVKNLGKRPKKQRKVGKKRPVETKPTAPLGKSGRPSRAAARRARP